MKQAATMGVSSNMQMANAEAASIFQTAAASGDANAMTTANVNYQNTLAMNAMNAQMTKSLIEQQFEQMSEAQLEPLKIWKNSLQWKKQTSNPESSSSKVRNRLQEKWKNQARKTSFRNTPVEVNKQNKFRKGSVTAEPFLLLISNHQ